MSCYLRFNCSLLSFIVNNYYGVWLKEHYLNFKFLSNDNINLFSRYLLFFKSILLKTFNKKPLNKQYYKRVLVSKNNKLLIYVQQLKKSLANIDFLQKHAKLICKFSSDLKDYCHYRIQVLL